MIDRQTGHLTTLRNFGWLLYLIGKTDLSYHIPPGSIDHVNFLNINTVDCQVTSDKNGQGKSFFEG